MTPRALWTCTLASVLSAGVVAGCKSKRAPAQARPSPSASSSAQPRVDAPRKSPSDLKAPPLAPPEDAVASVEGVKWKLLSEGTGEVLGELDSVQADLSVWTTDGKLFFSSYQHPAPVVFRAGLLPPGIYTELCKIKAGGKAWFWFSADFVQRDEARRSAKLPFPQADLIMEYEPHAIVRREARSAEPPSEVVMTRRFPKPDASGPPKTARRTPGGLRFTELQGATGARKPERDSKLALRLTVWPVTGLVVEPPILKEEPSATTLARAPAGLSELLKTMSEGATVRVWLPAGKAGLVVPLDKGRDAILDLTLEKIE
jgi:FKBP-type peptidyl-prolyl cis-trans isomerase